MNEDKNILTLSDGQDFVASLHEDELHNARATTITPAARRDAGVMAEAFALAWAHINRALHPRVPGEVSVIDGDIVSITKGQLKQLSVAMLRAGLEDDAVVHLRVDRGHLEAFIITPRMDNGGRELYRSPAAIRPYAADEQQKPGQ